jgi:hypothetical protein
VARQIEALRAGPFDMGDLSGSCTFVTLQSAIATNNSPESDLRTVRLHETTSPELQLRRKAGALWWLFFGWPYIRLVVSSLLPRPSVTS